MKKYSLIDVGKYSLIVIPISYILGLIIMFFIKTWEFFV